MRYQLRYIRAQRTRSSPGAKDDDSPRKRAHTNLFARAVSRLSRDPVRRMWRFAMSDACYSSTSFASRRRSRGSVGERPLHTRKVAGSIPAGTTNIGAGQTQHLGLRSGGVPNTCQRVSRVFTANNRIAPGRKR
jgi:hypothetical protein